MILCASPKIWKWSQAVYKLAIAVIATQTKQQKFMLMQNYVKAMSKTAYSTFTEMRSNRESQPFNNLGWLGGLESAVVGGWVASALAIEKSSLQQYQTVTGCLISDS